MGGKATLTNVLVVSGGGFQGLSVLKGLLQDGTIRVVLADCYEENIGRYFAHRSYVVPPIAESGRFVDSLLAICEAEDIQIVFPATELELGILAGKAKTFWDRNVFVAVSSAEFLKRVCDKKELYEFLRQEQLPSPPSIEIASGSVHFPVLGKPRSGWGGKGQLVLRSKEELERHSLRGLQDGYVWQPFLRDFVEYSIDFAINLAGEISEFCIRERVRVSGGFAVIARSREDEQIRRLVERFTRVAAANGGKGVLNLQIIAAAGDHFISDVNPRIGTSATFGYGVGINLPAFVCGRGRNGNHSHVELGGSVTMVRYLEEIFVQQENLEGIRGVVFDLDDTLINQKRWILSKLRGLHAEFKSELPNENVFLAQAMLTIEEGNRSKLIDALADHFGLGTRLNRELIAAYRNICPQDGLVFADVWPFMDELRRRGYKLAILTNNPPRSQRQKIEACGFQNRFDAIVYAQELNAEKPTSEGFLAVAGLLDVLPDELIMIGDHLYSDIGGALRSGYRHGFLIERSGGFFNFETDAFRELFGRDQQFTVISSLQDTLRYLKEVG